MQITNLEELSKASDRELLSVLGMHALPLLQDPVQTLEEGRKGEYWTTGPAVLGDEETFEHRSFERIGKLFLRKWSEQLAIAICDNDSLYRDLQTKSLAQFGVVVGLITAALTTSIPLLAPYSGLITIMAVFIARSGREAFCKMLSELKESAQSTPSR